MIEIQAVIALRPDHTRILALRDAGQTLLKARLGPAPDQHQALDTLLQALARWEGLPVRAVLVVDGPVHSPGSRRFRIAQGSEEPGAAYTLDLLAGRPSMAPEDRVEANEDFADLHRLALEEVRS